MPIALAGAAIAGPIVGGVIGNLASAADRRKAQDAMKDALDIIDQVGAPPDLSAKIVLDHLKQAGVLTPKMEQDINLQFSKVAQIKENQPTVDTQKEALRAIAARGQVGLGPEDRAALNQIQRQVASDTEAKRQQILQSMQARGMGGSGTDLIAQLQASQAGSDQAAQNSLNVGAQASQRALEALSQAGQLGGQMRQQDFGIAQAKANAEDVVNKFNTEQAMGRQQRNVQTGNEAAAQNLKEAQRIQDYNTQIENQEKYRQAEAKRQNWLDSLNYAGQRSGARTGEQNFYADQAKQQAQMWGNIGSGAGQAAGSVYGAQSKKPAS